MQTSIPVSQLVQEVSRAAYRGEAAAFLGSGISVPSGLPNWHGLLRPLVSPLGIEVRDTEEDLPLLAQYVVDVNAGNRGKLVSAVKESIQRSGARPNHYHRSIAKSTIDLIWTTNFDMLLEQAYGPVPVIVRARDTDMSLLAENDSVEIIKAHGCIGRSAGNELVLTLEDFEDYFVDRPLITERLRVDLQSRIFFFAGYSYGDPDIASILVEARRLARKTPKRRFMLMTRSKQGGGDGIVRQDLWAMDIARVGIECAFVKDYDEYATAMEEISIKSRCPTLYVTGSHLGSGKLAEDVGVKLAEQRDVRVVLLDGQSTGTSRSLISAFVQRAAELRMDFRDRLRFYSNPYASVPELSNDASLIPRLKEWRASMLRTAHTVLAFDGGMGTEAEVQLAADLGCRLILVPEQSGGSSRRLLDASEIAGSIATPAQSILSKPSDWVPTASDVVDWILGTLPQDIN